VTRVTDSELMSGLAKLSPREVPALLVASLEGQGATFTLKPDGDFLCDLNGIPNYTYKKAEDMARCVLALRAGIKAELRAPRVLH
jgi:hypothetical protein